MKINFLKKIVIHSLSLIGVTALAHYLARDKITILYMHSIIDLKKTHNWLPLRDFTSLTDLEMSLSILNKHYKFISLQDALAILKGQKMPIKNALVITLDDGYRNNISDARSIFQKYEIIPTLFVATNHVSLQIPFWFDRLDFILQQVKAPLLKIRLKNVFFTFNCHSRSALQSTYAQFRVQVKLAFSSDILMQKYLHKLAEQLEKELGCALGDAPDATHCGAIVDWQMLAHQLQNQSIEVGGHSVTHARLAYVDDACLRDELKNSQEIIEQRLKTACYAFCYPDNSYNDKVLALTNEYYELATTTDKGLNTIGDDLMRLKRFNLPTLADPKRLLFSISALRHNIFK